MRRLKPWLLGLTIFIAATTLGLWLSKSSGEPVINEETVNVILARAANAFDRGDYFEAYHQLRQLPETKRQEPPIKLQLGRTLSRLHYWQAAEAAWKEALQAQPTLSEGYFLLLNQYFIEQRWQDSRQLVLEAHPTQPDRNVRVALLLELVRQEFERLSPALVVQLIEPVVVREPSNLHALRNVGRAYVLLGRITEGLALLEQVVAQDPKLTDGWLDLIYCLLETGRHGQIQQRWEKLPPAIREHAVALRYRGLAAAASGNQKEAEQFYREALAKDPFDRKTHYLLGKIYRAGGSTDQAAKHEATAQRLDHAREALADCFTKAKNQNLNPSPQLCQRFSQLCRTLGWQDQAASWLTEAQ